MLSKLGRALRSSALAVVLAGLAPAYASAQTEPPGGATTAPAGATMTAPPGAAVTPPAGMAMPPGMTREMMRMMMTPGAAHPKGLPKSLVPFGGCIPAMGFHYAKKTDWPMGPLYGYYQGRPVFTELMPSVAQFKAGFELDNIKALPGYKIDHIDIWYEQHGHPGMAVPHYDVHAFYVPHAEHMKFCNNPSGQRPAFMRPDLPSTK